MLRRQLLIGLGMMPVLPCLTPSSLAQALDEPEALACDGWIELLDDEAPGLLEDGFVRVSHRAATSTGTERQQALRLINSERAKAGAAPLTLVSRLNCAAQGHARYMSSTRRCGHAGSGGSTAVQRVEACGYSWRAVGENVACGFDTWAAATKALMKSPGHRANILSSRYRNIGFGRYNHYYVQNFGTER